MKKDYEDEELSSYSQPPNSESQPQSDHAILLKLAPPSEEISLKPAQSESRNQPQTHEEPLHRQLTIIKESRPRLIIDRMMLQNFKSYAGKQKVGCFHPNFTSVVGPNGSGKSNLIESMLFIFGFSAHWMRMKKLNQLIHNSSHSSNMLMAAVEIHFRKVYDHEDGTIGQVSNSGFFIRRTVNSQSHSKYFLNGKDSTQAEIKECLKAEGIDLTNNRFLILQGEVQQISLMKQKSGDPEKPGLLQYLEEIIGSSQFIEKIEANVQEYNQMEEIKHQRGQIMKNCQLQIKDLSKNKEQAVQYVKKEKKIYQIFNVLNQVIIFNARLERNKTTRQLEETAAARDRIVREEKQKLFKQAQRIKQIKRNRDEMEEVQKQLEKCQDHINKLTTTDKNITTEVSFKSEDLVKYERKTDEADKDLQKIINQSEEIKQKLPQQLDKLKKMRDRLDGLKQELSKHDKPELKQKIKDLEIEIKRIQLQLDTYSSKLQTCQQAYEQAHSNQDQHELKMKQYSQKVAENKQFKNHIEIAMSKADKVGKELQEKSIQSEKERGVVKNELNQIENELREHQTESEQSGQMNNMFKEIMKQKIAGVIGRLGDLGTTSKEYDEIITTACPKLDNIVVADLEAAKAVVDFLTKTKLGRATCIILDKIEDSRHYMNRPFLPLSNATRLFDVIDFRTEEARLAFYFVLSNTIYVSDSNLGLEYSMGNDQDRRRVISKNRSGGYIIYEINGLMMGSYPKKGGFDQKATFKGKTKEKLNFSHIEDQKRTLIKRLEDLHRKIQDDQQKLKTAVDDLEQLRRELYSVNQNIKEFTQELRDLQEQRVKNKTINSSNQGLENQIKSMVEKIKNLNVFKQEKEEKLQVIENEQKKTQTAALGKMRQVFKEEKNQYNRFQKQVDKQKAVLETTVKRVEENKTNKMQTINRIEKIKKQIEKLKSEQNELEAKASEVIGKITGYEQKLKNLKKNDIELKQVAEEDEKELRESKTKVQKARKDVQICEERLNEHGKDLKLAESELNKCRKEYEDLTESYDFMKDLEEIEKMRIEPHSKFQESHNHSMNSSLLELSLSESFDASIPKIFPIDKFNNFDPLHNLSDDQIEGFLLFRQKLKAMLTLEKNALAKMDPNNVHIISQFKKKYLHYRERLADFEAVKQKQQSLKKQINSLKESRLQMFREGFTIIKSKLKEIYQLLTRGGDAELELIDTLDPFSDGVNFSVRPPKKSWKEVNKLSGGEKTLSSLSLIFALHHFKPTPLYFMDEIDAALDYKNVAIVADYIKKRTKNAQFIIISLRNHMFEMADKLIGVYKVHDKTGTVNYAPKKESEKNK